MVCNPPGSSVHSILQARTLEWVVISFFRGSSLPASPALAGRFFTSESAGKPHQIRRWCLTISCLLLIWLPRSNAGSLRKLSNTEKGHGNPPGFSLMLPPLSCQHHLKVVLGQKESLSFIECLEFTNGRGKYSLRDIFFHFNSVVIV